MMITYTYSWAQTYITFVLFTSIVKYKSDALPKTALQLK
jgi:hypothetical protein